MNNSTPPKDEGKVKSRQRRELQRQVHLGISLHGGMNFASNTECVTKMEAVETVDIYVERHFVESESEEFLLLCEAIGALPKVRTLRIRSSLFTGMADFSISALVALLTKSKSSDCQRTSLETLQLTCLKFIGNRGIEDVSAALEKHHAGLLSFQIKSCAMSDELLIVDDSSTLGHLVESLGKLSQLEYIQINACTLGSLGDHQLQSLFSSPTLQSLLLDSVVLKPGQAALISNTMREAYSKGKSQLKKLILNTSICSDNDTEEVPLATMLGDKCCQLEELGVHLCMDAEGRNTLKDLISAMETNASVKKLCVTMRGSSKYERISLQNQQALTRVLQYDNFTLESLCFHSRRSNFILKENMQQLQFYLSLNKSGLRRQLLHRTATPEQWTDALSSKRLSSKRSELSTIFYLLSNHPTILNCS